MELLLVALKQMRLPLLEIVTVDGSFTLRKELAFHEVICDTLMV